MKKEVEPQFIVCWLTTNYEMKFAYYMSAEPANIAYDKLSKGRLHRSVYVARITNYTENPF
jgi:hypothetical protein